MTSLQLVNLSKEYENGVYGVKNINLDVVPGEFIVLVGPSGCGKSTLLRLIAGLETLTSGELRFDGILMNEASARQRDIGMVFQNYALYPHLSVFENLAFPLRVRKMDKAQYTTRVNEVASILSIQHLLDRLPKQLSGGQRQRVAVGRAIVRNPRIFLFDEPLSNLDANLRVEMRSELSSLQKRFGTTSVYVTHDHVEAMTMGDRIVVLNNGSIMQVGSPQDLYSNPDNDFVAGFLGTPSINFFEGSIVHDDGLRFVDTELGLNVILEPQLFTRSTAAPQKVARCALRAEDLRLTEHGSPADFQATVEMVEYVGHESIIHFKRESQLLSVRSYDAKVPTRGERAAFSLNPANILLFDEQGRRL